MLSDNYPSDFFDEQSQCKNELCKLLIESKPLLFIGAGSSMRIGYPSWDELIDQIEKEAKTIGIELENHDKEKKLEKISFIKNEFIKIGKKEYYFEILKGIFEPKAKRFDDFHKKIVSFPVNGIITTNYDVILENAINERYDLDLGPYDIETQNTLQNSIYFREFMVDLTKKDPKYPSVLHLHGLYTNPEKIVLGIDDYKCLYGLDVSSNSGERNGLISNELEKVKAILVGNRLIFIGFSLEDEYINFLLNKACDILGSWNKTVHFAISPLKSIDQILYAKQLKIKTGINVLFYDNYDGFHSGLESLIDDVMDICHISYSQINWIDSVNQRMWGK